MLVLLGFETAIWHVFSTPKNPQNPQYPRSSFRRPFAALPWVLPRPHKLFLLGFAAIWHFRSATSCFYWASKLLSGTFSEPLKTPSKPSKPSQQLSTAFRCFAMGPPEAPQAVSVGLRDCYLALPKRHKLFLLGFETRNPLSTAFRCFAMGPPEAPRAVSLSGFETAIWHFRSATSCFYWASKLLSGTFSAPLKTLKTLKTLAAAFDGLSLLCHGSCRGPTSYFCWASKLLSGTSEAPQAVSIGLRNCYLARCSFRRPFAALPWVLPRPHKLFLLGFETAVWHFRSATSCFYWASKLLSGTFSAPLKSLKTIKKHSQQLSTAFRCFAMGPPARPNELFLLGFETAIWHFRGATSCFYWASKLLSGTSKAPQAASIGLRNCYMARF